ncbi:hypothetical protein [Herbiconiux sp. YIM B11900]|uniref:hypothetical protein n=1 Tax=Herbiconiux sp. YIM B11900 TaxID=3404131 RepID=UPI003F86D574
MNFIRETTGGAEAARSEIDSSDEATVMAGKKSQHRSNKQETFLVGMTHRLSEQEEATP